MDEFDEDEDEQIDIDGVPFAAEKDFLEKYGTAFTLSYGENKVAAGEKAGDFLRRAFTVIFIASIVIWFLQTFDPHLTMVADSQDSILALILIFWIVSAFSKALKPKKKAGEAGRKRAAARVDRENPAPAQPAPRSSRLPPSRPS